MKAIEYGNLIRAITYNMNDYISESCKSFGIGKGQFEYFLLIAQNPGINHLELANKKNVGKGSVTNAVKKLEMNGFVQRFVDKEDKRNSKCYMTEKGKLVLPKLLELSDHLEQHLFSSFSNDDRNHLYSYLEQLKINSSTLCNKKGDDL